MRYPDQNELRDIDRDIVTLRNGDHEDPAWEEVLDEDGDLIGWDIYVADQVVARVHYQPEGGSEPCETDGGLSDWRDAICRAGRLLKAQREGLQLAGLRRSELWAALGGRRDDEHTVVATATRVRGELDAAEALAVRLTDTGFRVTAILSGTDDHGRVLAAMAGGVTNLARRVRAQADELERARTLVGQLALGHLDVPAAIAELNRIALDALKRHADAIGLVEETWPPSVHPSGGLDGRVPGGLNTGPGSGGDLAEVPAADPLRELVAHVGGGPVPDEEGRDTSQTRDPSKDGVLTGQAETATDAPGRSRTGEDPGLCPPSVQGVRMAAHDTGDGWYLHWIDDRGNELTEIPWPFGDSEVSPNDLRRLGFEVL